MTGRHRNLIIHYHQFKNAGTSVDAILRKNFGAAWVAQEYLDPSEMAQAARTFIAENPDVVALSSHTLQLPAPEIEGVSVFPVILLRHPLDRIRSMYDFERGQRAETYGAQLAKRTDLAGYITDRLSRTGDRACRSSQTYRLAMAEPGACERERALRALDRLFFVGSVEAFAASMARFEQLLKPIFPQFHTFPTWENASSAAGQTLDERLADMKAEIGAALFEELAVANADDQALYDAVRQLYQEPE